MQKKKMGRPVIGEPKNVRIELRLTKELVDKLDTECAKKKMSRSEFIRELISNL